MRMLALCLLVCALPVHAQGDQLLSDAAIEARLRAYVDVAKLAPGAVVGVIDVGGRRIIAYGDSGNPLRPQLAADSVFEIGSITKVHTALLLAQMVEAGEVAFEQRIDSLFPREIALSERLGSITLAELSMHTSGLPRVALDPGPLLRGLFARDPYRGSTAQEIYNSVASLPAARLGARGEFSYSNLGVALLGQLLARRVDTSYAELLAARVFTPLQLAAGSLSPMDRDDPRWVQGYRENLRPAPAWHLDAYAPAGGLQASAAELLDFADTQLAPGKAWVELAQRERQSIDPQTQRRIALGWVISRVGKREVWWHNGGTGGFRSHLALVPAEKLALVVLTNGNGDADSLALSLLDPAPPAPQPFVYSWLGILASLGGLLLAPMLTLRLFARADDTPPNKRRADRLDVLNAVLAIGVVLLLLERMGAWASLPFALWWLCAAISATAVLLAALRAAAWPWRSSAGGWRLFLRGTGLLFTAVVFWLLS